MTDDLYASPSQSLNQYSGNAHAPCEFNERAVQRFAPAARREIRRIIKACPRAGDLCETFPGILYVLAAGSISASERADTLSAIEAGVPLKNVARRLGLPMWLRKLPAEAFVGDLSGPLPQSPSFTRQIAHRLPRTTRESPTWLQAVVCAHEACGEDFAIWLAQQRIFEEDFAARRALAILAAYAWHSGRPDTDAFKLIVVPWRSEIAFDTALCAAKSWFNRIRLVLQLPKGALLDSWLRPGTAQGYSFEPLLDSDCLLKEATEMHNCADQYAERLISERCRLFGVRRGGVPIATLEIGPHMRENGVLTINQLKGRHNLAAPLEVWQAAYAWMAQQTDLCRLPNLNPRPRTWDQSAWSSLMASYRNAHAGAPWFDPTASHLGFASLNADLTELARRGGVSSWLFT